jgi:glucose-6-phosphate isomerase
MRDLFATDAKRFSRFSIRFDDMLFDFSKNRITKETFALLIRLAKEAGVEKYRMAMFNGERINITENRAVLHVALRNRSDRPICVDGVNVMPEVNCALTKMCNFSTVVRNGSWFNINDGIVDIVNIGIGGSNMGPMMVIEALKPFVQNGITCHFISNVDDSNIYQVLKRCRPETTLFIIASKTFTTQETIINSQTARAWIVKNLGEKAITRHFVAISANKNAAISFGIDINNIFSFWDWVGGRYSLWSTIGLSIAIAVGFERFEELLFGAFDIDEHFRMEPLAKNIPVIMAMLGIWYIDFFGATTHAILPYDQYLYRFPSYLQQTDMESNGKSITRDGRMVDYHTGPILFGDVGTNGQHAFYQLIYQGTQLIPADFIATVCSHNPVGNHHRLLMSNYFAQSKALMIGKSRETVRDELIQQGFSGDSLEIAISHRVVLGNRPTNSLLYCKLTPRTLGRLIALYEHKIFVQGVIWQINSFDQWGVELGKKLANIILPELNGSKQTDAHDSSTNGLINHYNELC